MRWLSLKGVRPALVIAVFLILSLGGGMYWAVSQTFPGGVGANPTVVRFPGGLRIQIGVTGNAIPGASIFAPYTGCTVTNIGIVAVAATNTASQSFAVAATSAAGATLTNIGPTAAAGGSTAFYVAFCL